MLTEHQIAEFQTNGFIIERGLIDTDARARMLDIVQCSLEPPLAPVEYETDVQYPGSPQDRLSPGGNTPRRLLHAYTRHQLFRDWATGKVVTARVRQLLGTDAIALSQNHHNCIMTKHPGFSSATLWHQDIRYWLFDQPDLVSVWLALGQENSTNGGVHLIPGSHREWLARGRFDGALFLRQDLKANQVLIASAKAAELAAGDVLFFHSKTLHAAGQNNTDQIKTSLVFTYHAVANQPLAGTRSATYSDIPC